MKKLAPYALFLYSLALLIGGIFGFYLKGSLPSLYMGITMSLLLDLAALLIIRREKPGFYMALFLTASCFTIFLIRYLKTGALIPALLFTLLSLSMFLYLTLCMRLSGYFAKEHRALGKNRSGDRTN